MGAADPPTPGGAPPINAAETSTAHAPHGAQTESLSTAASVLELRACVDELAAQQQQQQREAQALVAELLAELRALRAQRLAVPAATPIVLSRELPAPADQVSSLVRAGGAGGAPEPEHSSAALPKHPAPPPSSWRRSSAVHPLAGARDGADGEPPLASKGDRPNGAGGEHVPQEPARRRSVLNTALDALGSVRGRRAGHKGGEAPAEAEAAPEKGASPDAGLQPAEKRHMSFLSADHVGEALRSNAELNSLLASIQRDQRKELEKRGELRGDASPTHARLELRGRQATSSSQGLKGAAAPSGALATSRFSYLAGLVRANQTRRAQTAKSRFVVHPETTAKYRWDALVICAVLVSTITVPFRLAFSLDFEPIMAPVVAVDSVTDILFAIDIVLCFFSGFRKADESGASMVVLNHSAIVRRYLGGWFLLDVVSVFPFDMLIGDDSNAGRINRTLRMFRVIKLFRVFRMSRALNQLEMQLTAFNPAIFRIVKLVLLLMLLWHWIGCLWFTIRFFDLSDIPNLVLLYNDGLTETPDLSNVRMSELLSLSGLAPELAAEFRERLTAKLMDQYSFVYFWGAATMSGEILSTPRHSGEAWYTTLVSVLGVFLNAAVIGSASSAFSNLDAASARNKERLDKLRAFLHFKKTPSSITSRVLAYAEFAWTRSRSDNERWLMQELPSALRIQVMISLQRKLFTQIELFMRLPVAISCSIISCMKPLICLPDEEIITEASGTVGLFFITEGTVSVIRRGKRGEPDEKLSELHDGDYFGETSLLGGTRDAVSMVARGFVNLQVLYESEFKRLSEAHPEIAGTMAEMRAERQRLEDATRTPNGGAAGGSPPRIKRTCNMAVQSMRLAASLRATRAAAAAAAAAQAPAAEGGARDPAQLPAQMHEAGAPLESVRDMSERSLLAMVEG